MEKINYQELGLKKAREVYGEEAEKALRDHLKLIGKEFYRWMSDLYQPRKCICENFDEDGNRICLLPRDENGVCLCEGGGYFFSNCARDFDEFKIDIESTVQALNFLITSGLIRDFDGDFKKALPKQMQYDVIAFAKSLQDPEDGYFYHPQWGKDIIPSRQGRDLTWATSILNALGEMPLYDTKNGVKGSLGAPSGMKPSEDSKKGSNDTWIEHLRTLDAFVDYINAFDLKTKSYSSANNITAQSGQIIARDKYGIETGEFTELRPDGYAVGGFVDTLQRLLAEKQNPENGLWEDEVHYNSVNGLMKMMLAHNHFGFRLGHPEKAFASAIKILLLDKDVPDVRGKQPTGSVDTYNPWSAMSSIISNVKKFGTEEELKQIKDMLKENVVAMIRASTDKASMFKKPDGSFGYTWINGTMKHPLEARQYRSSQMARVAYYGVVEGDINGGSIATRGIFVSMCSALGLDIPFYTGDDFEDYIGRINERCGYK